MRSDLSLTELHFHFTVLIFHWLAFVISHHRVFYDAVVVWRQLQHICWVKHQMLVLLSTEILRSTDHLCDIFVFVQDVDILEVVHANDLPD